MIANLHFITPDIARSAQSWTMGQLLGILTHHRFKSVLNLRGANPNSSWYISECAACTATDTVHHDLTLSSKRLPSREVLLNLLDALDNLPKPLLVKCSGGADRTGLTGALYILHQKGSSALPEALLQLSLFPYLHFAKPWQRWIKELLYFYEATSYGLPLKSWLTQYYSQSNFAEHLIAQGKASYWKRG